MPLPRILPALAASLVAIAFGSCGGGDESTTDATAAGCEAADRPAPKDVHYGSPGQVLKPGEKATATVETTCGDFVIELDTKRSPKTANSFAFLAEHGVYDRTWFQRIVPDFLIQGGDPAQDGSGGAGYTVVEPPPPNTSYLKDFVAMGKTGIQPSGTSGSQFFVVTATDAGLPPDYALLGQVIKGGDVVDRIGALGDPASGQNGTPTQAVVIRTIRIEAG